jgi:DNA-binding NarL/FixJ family response regulator
VGVRILLIDDNAGLRGGYRALIGRVQGWSVVGEAADGDEALDAIARWNPDLVLMDVEMKRMGGLHATRVLSHSHVGHPKVLMASSHADERLVVEALRAGASGYLLKTEAARELIPAIEKVMNGGVFVSRRVGELNGALSHQVQPAPIAVDMLRRLAPAEGRLVELMRDGRSDAEASNELGLSPGLFEVLRGRVMEHLSLKTREELAGFAQFGPQSHAMRTSAVQR